ncbi:MULTISPECIES: type II secretion system minor pseudopilin GspK [Pseudomonas]|uniref:Type II secretion system protein K n=1 Tax=Pseudomonas solani TaxID=2731552 RepID=A0AAU7Y8A3_9PSED|nr:type II secretion system minor pseudopilin GspK [Pseudomonas sp. TUM22785]WCD78114.1 type II secretion system minor pseudopilin GspK [Pseudomonas sp. TUM22785]
MSERHRQRGVALISVLLVTALVTLIISDMLARQRLSLASSANQLQQQQLWQLALSGEAWARQQLHDDLATREEPLRVHLGQGWARNGNLFDIDGGQIRIRIEDLAGRFDLDTQRSTSRLARARYQRLLANLGLPHHDPALLPQRPGADGKPQPFADSSELARLEQLDAAGLQRLRPHVATLGGVALNLNTASAEVLASLEGLDPAIARTLVQARPPQGYASVQAFMEQPLLHGREVSSRELGVDSRHFRAHLQVRLGERQLYLASDLRLERDGRINVLRRQLLAPDLSHPE